MDYEIADSFIEYKDTTVELIRNSKEVISLMADNPDLDIESDEAYEFSTNNIYDYSFTDDAFQNDRAVIFIDCVFDQRPTEDFFRTYLYVQILCNKDYCKLDRKKWKGTTGNRRDNIAVQVAQILEDSDLYGVGNLKLVSMAPTTGTANKFSSITLTFEDTGNYA